MDTEPDIVATTVAGLVILATAAFAFLQHIRSRPRCPAAAQATMDLGPEPPAVVDLLTDDFVVTAEAVPATLVDLAARRWLSIEEVGGGDVIIRLRREGREESLAPYESRILGHLETLAVDGVVPAAAMTTGPRGASKQWWRSFRREVVADAQTRGLCRERWTKAMLAPISAGVVVAGALSWLALELGDARDDTAGPDAVGWLWVLVVLAAVVVGAWASALARRDLQRDTEAGLASASRWLGVRDHLADTGDFGDKPAAMVVLWDRYLAHAVALDLAPLVVAQLPLGAEDHHHTWSRASGRWRQVRVRYPFLRPGYGQHPALAALTAVAAGTAAALAFRFAVRLRGDDVDVFADVSGGARRGLGLAILVLGGLALVVVLWNTAKLVMAVTDVVGVEVQEGEVLRTRVRRGWVGLTEEPSTSSDDRVREQFFCALDTGEAPVVAAWRVRRSVFDQLRQGGRYRVTVTPRLRHVRSVETVVEDNGDGSNRG